MLTPKVQKDFESYLENVMNILVEAFWNSPLNMQFGVIKEYFWFKHKIPIYIEPIDDKYEGIMYFAFYSKKKYIICESMDKARKTAIQEASKLSEDRL